MSIPHMPLSHHRQRKKTNNEIVHANAPQPPEERPYLLKMLQRGLGTRVLADTLDWDALAQYHLDASMLSLDNVYKGLNHDLETYYFLWVAVRKVLGEAPPNVMFSGARVRADQKTQFLNELLDAALEQFLAELGDALMNFVEGPHCTIIDPRNDGDPDAIRSKARSLIARFEKLGRSKDMLMVAIPATESGIEAAARLQREDGINVNLTFVSGVMHATACAQSGAVAVTLSIAKMRDWRRGIGRDVGDSEEDVVGAGGEDAETIAAYFDLHGLSSTTGLIAGKMNHVDDACPLAALAALSFDANQLKKAEWYTAYPRVPLALSDHALRRANALSPPPPPPGDAATDAAPVKTMLKLMNAQAFSAFAAITYAAVGSGRAAMSMIADIARAEIDWQLFLMRPLSSINAVATSARAAASAQRRPRPRPRPRPGSSRLSVPAPVGVGVGTRASIVPAARGMRDHPHHPVLGKRRRSPAEVAEAERGTPDSPRPPPEKKAKCNCSEGCSFSYPWPPRISSMTPQEGTWDQRRAPASRRPSTPRPRQAALADEAAPDCALWEPLRGRNVSPCYYSDDRDESKGRAPQRKH